MAKSNVQNVLKAVEEAKGKQAQVVVNNGAGRVNLPVGTDASKLTGQDVQQIVKTSPVKQVITPEQTAQATKQNGNTVYLPTGTAVPLSQRAKTVNLPQGNTGVKGEAWQRQMLDSMMRGEQQSSGSAAPEESNWDAFKRGFGYGSERLAASLLGFGENVTDFLGSGAYKGAQALASLGGLTPNAVSDYFGKVADSYYDDSITDRYEESIRQRYNPTQRDEMVTGVGQSITQILAASALGQAGGAATEAMSGAAKIADAAQKARTAEAISKAAFGLSAAGGSAREAIKEGASTEQALAYGAAAGSMETLIESIAGGIPGLGKGKLSEVVRKIVNNPIVSKTVDIAGEGAEEAASAFLTPFIKRAIYNKNAEFASADEIAQNAILGMITSGVLQAGVELPQVIGNRKVNLPMAKSAQERASTETNPVGVFDETKGTAQNPATKQDVSDFVDYALYFSDEKRKNEDADIPKQKEMIVYGVADDRLVNDIKSIYGVDLSGMYHVLGDNDIRHINNSHGSRKKTEKYPVTAEDLKAIPDIVTGYDDVLYVPREDGKSGIFYVKRHNGTTYYLEQIRKGNILQNKQMIKTSTGKIPDVAGLRDAINKKWNINTAPNDPKIPRMYVQDVWSNVPDTSIAQTDDTVNTSDQSRDYTVSNGSVGNYLTAAISEEGKALGKSLGVPYSRRSDFAKERLIELANSYMRTGEFDADAALSIFDEGWDQGQLINQDYYNNYQDLRRELQATNLQITEDVKRNIPDFAEWRKRNRYKVGMTENGGMPIDTKYQELSAAHPELFPESITDLSDQLQKIADVSGELYAVPKTLSEIYGDQTGENYRNMRKSFSDRMLSFEQKLKQARTVQAETDAKNVKEATPGTLDAAKKAYAAAKKARKAYEKLSGKSTTLLSDQQKRQVQALAMGKLTEAEIPESAAKQTILALANLKRQELEALAPVKEYKIQYRNGLRNTAASLLEGSYAWKDKETGLQYSRETMERNIRDMAKDKKQADAIIAEYFTPVHKQEAERTRFRNQMRDRIRALKLTKDESAAVQYLGEKRAQIAEWEERGFKNPRDKRDFEGLKSEVEEWKRNHPNIDYAKVDNAIDVFRKTYNELFARMNEVRVRNGYEPVDYRKNYFPHFLENQPDTLIAKLGGALGIEMNVKELPVDIAGRTHTFRPGIQWFGNIQRRTTDETVYDAVRGFDQYIEGISNVIYHTDNIQKLRALSNEIRYEGTEVAIQEQIDRIRDDPNMSDYEKNARIKDIYDEQPTKLSKFVQELEEYTNILAGKKSRRDRNMEGNIGRKLYSMAKTLNNRVAANMVALNPGSWVTNFAPAIQTATQTNPITMARAIKDTVRSYVQDDGFANESTFLTNRRGSNPLVVDAFEKVSNFLSSPMEWIDHFTSDTVVRARYYDNMNRGMDHQSALDEADSYAAGLIGDRSKGAMPTLFEAKNPLTKTFTAFQLEVNNQLSWMFKDLPRDERNKGVAMVAWKLMSLFIGSYLANDLYEKLRGSRVLFDPLSWVNDAVGDITGYQMPNVVDIAKNAFAGENKLPFRELAQTETTKLPQAFTTLGTNAVSELPFVGGLLGGGRLPISSAIPDASQLVRLTDPEIAWDRKKKILQDELLKKPAAYLLLPTGGGQIKKTVEGLATVNAGGSYTLDNEGRRKLQYPVFKNGDASDAMTWGQAALFGKSSLPMAKEWVDSGFKTKSVKFTEAYDYLSQEGVNTKEAYNLLERLNEIQKTDDASETVLKREELLADQTLTPQQKTKVDQILFEPKNPVDYSSAAAQRKSLATDSQKEKIAEFEKIGGGADDFYRIDDKLFASGTTEEKKRYYTEQLTSEQKSFIKKLPQGTASTSWLERIALYNQNEDPKLASAYDNLMIGSRTEKIDYTDVASVYLSLIDSGASSKIGDKYYEYAQPAGVSVEDYMIAYFAQKDVTYPAKTPGAKAAAEKAAIDKALPNLSQEKRNALYKAFK